MEVAIQVGTAIVGAYRAAVAFVGNPLANVVGQAAANEVGKFVVNAALTVGAQCAAPLQAPAECQGWRS